MKIKLCVGTMRFRRFMYMIHNANTLNKWNSTADQTFSYTQTFWVNIYLMYRPAYPFQISLLLI